MPSTDCLVCLVSNVSGCHKNTLGRAITCSRHMTKLEQSTFLDIYESDLYSQQTHLCFGLLKEGKLTEGEGPETGLLNKRLMLSTSFRCDQIYKYEIYNFGHTLLCYLSWT